MNETEPGVGAGPDTGSGQQFAQSDLPTWGEPGSQQPESQRPGVAEVAPGAAAVLARLHAALDELSVLTGSGGSGGLGLAGQTDAQVLGLWRELERVRRRLASPDHALISEVEQRHLAHSCGARSVVALAREVLRVGSGEARARVGAAQACGPRRGLTGQELGPIYRGVADAQAGGDISATHAAIIVSTIEKLPDAIRADLDTVIEDCLLTQARELDPDTLTRAARRLSDRADPDGSLRDLAYRATHRQFRLHQRADGSSHGEFDATAELTEYLLTTFDALAAPRSALEGVPDPRTAGQRRHDALLDTLKMVMRAEALPSAGGVTTTVVLTATTDAFGTGTGTATTAHGATIPAAEARRWAASDSRFLGVLFHRARIVAQTGTHRLFTENQRLAMIARDHGCSFPGCDAPPAWSEAHHVTDYAAGGPTSIDNGTLVCGVHHREHPAMGWTCTMINGQPHWIPPRWIDPEQRPRRNHTHHPPGRFQDPRRQDPRRQDPRRQDPRRQDPRRQDPRREDPLPEDPCREGPPDEDLCPEDPHQYQFAGATNSAPPTNAGFTHA